jgi:hypothetical protein
MKFKRILLGALLLLPTLAHADYSQRLSLGAGIITRNGTNETNFEIGGEYEYRVNEFLGMGAHGNYIFSGSGIWLIGLPEFFIHPFGSEWFVSASPIVEFGADIETKTGGRFGTRIPLPLGSLTLIPSFAVDLIGGSQNYTFGLGIQI